MSCVVCENAKILHFYTDEKITLWRCQECRHIEVNHHNLVYGTVDYHKQYEQVGFLRALAVTRQRQSQKLVELLKRLFGDFRVCDFGAGRGFFLKACKDAGVKDIGGNDFSEIAVDGLRKVGVTATRVDLNDASSINTAVDVMGFVPNVVSFLDVVEHFDRDHLFTNMEALQKANVDPNHALVIKVPRNDGLLFRLAVLMAHLGAAGTLQQMCQVGTFPPHFQYFSSKSLRQYIHRCGFIEVERVLDPDFDFCCFSERVAVKNFLLRPIINMCAAVIYVICRALELDDAETIVAKSTN
jgi:2-polyprenyl-3-methyl-5-hydroxy-6-metoxy-1,4-benzoquinol methylase